MEERRLLGVGMTCKDVATLIGTNPRRLEERNRLIYRIDVVVAFKSRMEREGVPVRVAVDDAFGYWFAGLFDGEGHFVINLRGPRRLGNSELCLGLNVYLRDDDAHVLKHVQDAIGGQFYPSSKDNVAHWRFRGLANLAEVAVPLFERYRLRSKKAVEFELFRSLVRQRYLATLGGRRKGVPLEDVEQIRRAISEMRARRRYADRSSWRLLESSATYGAVSSIAA